MFARSALSARRAIRQASLLRDRTLSARAAITIAFGVGLALLGAFSSILLGLRRRVGAAHPAEVQRLGSAALTDSLTGLRNLRAFQEDLARDLQTLAGVLAESFRGSDCAYRVGGDEFAVILADVGTWDAMEAIQRLQTKLVPRAIDVSAGITDGGELKELDAIIREADLALIAGKRHHHSVTIYSPELQPAVAAPDFARDADHVGSLANALALAVDAKDSYTRSHCQTVSQLCALIATELALTPAVITQMRLAGLLHDVGKIGIPDAILTKPAALTDAEYEQIERHSILGEEIVAAAGLVTEARWVRHRHERCDGAGYPDIRPSYRNASGRDFAITELKRHAGTQLTRSVSRRSAARWSHRNALRTPGAITPAAPASRRHERSW